MTRILAGIVDWLATPYAVYLVLKDPAISRAVKLRAAIGLAIIFAYVVSPIDIVPDFIPLSGWLDDLIVVPLGFAVLRQITPGIDVVETKGRAETSIRRIVLWTMLAVGFAVLAGLLWTGLLIYLVVRLIAR